MGAGVGVAGLGVPDGFGVPGVFTGVGFTVGFCVGLAVVAGVGDGDGVTTDDGIFLK